MEIICFLVAVFACSLGKICGNGGGVIIKPVLDALKVAPVADINFISGCTALGMSLWSVGKSCVQKDSQIDWKVSTPLAIGAAIGGTLGKQLFHAVASLFADANRAGGIQACVLLAFLAGALVYTVNRKKLPSHSVRHWMICGIIGVFLGALGAFLGIGGGPFNMAFFYFFFSMSTKTAAQNSLYVILLSQSAALIRQLISGAPASLSALFLLGMVFFGIVGSEIGGRVNKKLSEKQATGLFECSMLLVMCICAYNIAKYFVL